MTVTPDANDVLFGSNSPSANFDQPGTTIGGPITAPPRAFQEREWNNATQRSDGPPKTFASGDPMMGVALDVQTQVRDPSIQNDTGIRTIYIKGKRLKDAVREAVRAAGGQRLEVGAEIYVTFTGLGPAPSVGANQPKEYAVRYVPVAQAAVGLGQQQAPQQPVQQYQQPPAQQYAQPAAQPPQSANWAAPLPPTGSPNPATVPVQPAPQPAVQQPTPEQVAGLLANRMDPRTVFPAYQLTPEQAQQVAGFTQQG